MLEPRDVDAEHAVLSCLMSGGSAALASTQLTDAHFTESRIGIFRTLAELDEGGKLDLVALTIALREKGILETSGGVVNGNPAKGAVYLTSIFSNFAGGMGMLAHYCETLEDYRQRRIGVMACMKGEARFRDAGTSPLEAGAALERELHGIEAVSQQSETHRCAQEIERQIMARTMGVDVGITTGFPQWDRSVGPLRPARMIVLGSRPGIGKTALVEAMMQHQISAGYAVLCFQRDMSTTDMLARMACRKARVIYEHYNNCKCDADELARISKANRQLDGSKKLILESPVRFTTAAMRGFVKRHLRESKIAAVYLDVFQKIHNPGDARTSKAEVLTQASNDLRDIANDFQIPLIVVAHLNRDADDTKRPHAGQFKYCDQLFSDADTVALMWTDEDAKSEKIVNGARQHVILTIDKNRGGGVGDEHFYFDRPMMTFHGSRV